jgi:hypothetical protein
MSHIAWAQLKGMVELHDEIAKTETLNWNEGTTLGKREDTCSFTHSHPAQQLFYTMRYTK